MREILDTTNQYKRLPNGRYKLTVMSKPEKLMFGDKNKPVRKWIFNAKNEEGSIDFGEIQIFIPSWESKNLLLCLGGVETPEGKIDWDDERVSGLSISANVESKDYEGKDKNKNKVTKQKYIIYDIKEEEIPF